MPDPKEPPAAPAEDDEDDHGARLAKADGGVVSGAVGDGGLQNVRKARCSHRVSTDGGEVLHRLS